MMAVRVAETDVTVIPETTPDALIGHGSLNQEGESRMLSPHWLGTLATVGQDRQY